MYSSAGLPQCTKWMLQCDHPNGRRSCAGLSQCVLVLDCHSVLGGCCNGFSSCQLGEGCNYFTMYLNGCSSCDGL